MLAKRHLFGITAEELGAWCAEAGLEAYRAKQILEWVYAKGATSFEAMTNLPKGVRAELAAAFTLYESEVARRSASRDGTVKQLLRWADGATSECVMIPESRRRTACISSQVGCPVGCVFCASGLAGLERNLTAGQIVEQAMRVRSACGERGLTNVVLMGLGEPLANYEATVRAVRTINADWGLNVGARRITISTVGLPGRIRQLAEEGLQVTLAISLHAASDSLRAELIPWAQGVKIGELVEAANAYFSRIGREVTLEYVLLSGVNDGIPDAQALAGVAKKMRSNVNLIRYNPVSGLEYGRPTAEKTVAFQQVLRRAGVKVHVRKSRGLDIEAACGQLRRTEAARFGALEETRDER